MMDKNEIIERLEKLARCAVHTVGELPFVMSLDDGIAIHEAIDMLRSQPEPHWIPCSERLPEHPQPNTDFDGKPLAVYLVCRKGYIPFSAFWNGDFFTDDLTPIDVDAWMPLPESL